MKLQKVTLLLLVLILPLAGMPYVNASYVGDTSWVGDTRVKILTDVEMGSIVPVVKEVGKISLSIDGLGIIDSTGTIQVEKPTGATVRRAFLAAATVGWTDAHLKDGDIQLDGVDINWNMETPSNILSWNYWAEVTSIVKSKIDAAPSGRVDITVTEIISSELVDGVILAVIFDDPGQVVDNTVVLLFGAQDVNGDTFIINLGKPIDTSDPNLVLDFSLGISYGAQPYGQYSQVDVNGNRLTTSAGGQDDGDIVNGALLTVGGLDDSNSNPIDPYQTDIGGPRYDDELYDLIPFVSDGDISIQVYTLNPSDDDNVFFSALFLGSTQAWVGPGFVVPEFPQGSLVGLLTFLSALLAYSRVKMYTSI